jgi:hypothetical protein
MLCPTLRDVNLGAYCAAGYFGSFARTQNLAVPRRLSGVFARECLFSREDTHF